MTLQFICQVRGRRSANLNRHFGLRCAQRGQFLKGVAYGREFITHSIFRACSVIATSFSSLIGRRRQMAVQRRFTSAISVRCQDTIQVVSKDLGFILFSILTSRTYRLIISLVSQANDSCTTPSQFTSRYRIASRVSRLITYQLIIRCRQFVISMTRILCILVQSERLINGVIRRLLQCFLIVSSSHVIRIAAFSRIVLRRRLCFTSGRRYTKDDRFYQRFARIIRHNRLIKGREQVRKGRGVSTGLIIQRSGRK